ncbi:MAG: hypothetical protein ACPGTO_01905 [Polaribacter sp.]
MILDFVISLFLILFGFYVSKKYKLSNKNIVIARYLWIYHLIFCVYFYFSILSQGGSDSNRYWEDAILIKDIDMFLNMFLLKGTAAMIAINFFPSKVLGLSYFTGSIMYAFVGYLGILYFFKISIEKISLKVKFLNISLFPFLFFLPNLHFWTCNVGKDTLLFFCIAIIFYYIDKNKYIIPIIFAVIGFLVRPHIILFIIIAFGFTYLFNAKASIFKKGVLIGVLVGVFIIMLPKVLQYTQIESLNVENYNKFSEKKIKNLSRSHTGSSVDISSYPLPLKIFTFLYRPFFFDINGIPAILASFENLLLLLLTIKVFKNKPKIIFKNAPLIIKSLTIFLIIGTLSFSQILGNVGIMLRMRNMFLPGMFLFLLWSMAYMKSINYTQKNN